jgi:hypothetical protein
MLIHWRVIVISHIIPGPLRTLMILVIIYDMVGEWVATISNNIAGYMDDVH